jgi:hypothetical protein
MPLQQGFNVSHRLLREFLSVFHVDELFRLRLRSCEAAGEDGHEEHASQRRQGGLTVLRKRRKRRGSQEESG